MRSEFEKFHLFTVPGAFTYGDNKDPRKREQIRAAANEGFPQDIPGPPEEIEWGFRIAVSKTGKRHFDIENVPKLVIDAFCADQVRIDKKKHRPETRFPKVARLYEKDTIDYVTALEVHGERTSGKESMTVEIRYRRSIADSERKPAT